MLLCALWSGFAVAQSSFNAKLRRLGVNASRNMRASVSVSADVVSVDVLGVRVTMGCVAVVRDANATLEVRCKTPSFFDLRTASATDLEAPQCIGPTCAPALWRLRYSKEHSSTKLSKYSDAALLTSVSDLAYLWKYWRWIMNKLCVSTRVLHLRYYLWVGAPARGQTREATSSSCPARLEEPLAHTTKALSMYLALTLVKRVIFVDADAWFYTIHSFRTVDSALSSWIASSADADLAFPAPCYKQFFGAAIVMASRSAWALGFCRAWYDLRCGPKDQPSLWALVLKSAGLDDSADKVLQLYQDPRCLNSSTGELTKANCQCAPRSCGYYAAWTFANNIFKTALWRWENISETPSLYEIHHPLFTPNGGHVAYLPNVHSPNHTPLLCGPSAPIGHIKWLSKRHRNLPPDICGNLPLDVYFKGPRDDRFLPSDRLQRKTVAFRSNGRDTPLFTLEKPGRKRLRPKT